jgi:transposase
MMDRKIVELLIGGTGINQIARSLHVGKRRIRKLRIRAMEFGYLKEDGGKGSVVLPAYPEALFPDGVDGRSLRLSESHQHLKEHHEWIREHLAAGWHAVTVFEELPVNGIARSSFYRYLDRYELNRLGESYRVVSEIIHRPGEALILDWGKLRDVIDPETGKKKTLWMFMGVLGFSRYLMVRLVWRIDVTTTLEALESMFRELGGVSQRITVDNPKCIALEASPYEPLLNPMTERFAAHYGVRIEALPPGDPEKKGKIERMVPYGRRLYEAHGEAWNGIEESQTYLDKKLVIANDRRHGTTLRHPRELFMQEESKALKPLPALAYEVEQFHEGKLIEVHSRVTDPSQSKSTKPQHLKPWERAMQDDSMYRERAARIGPYVDEMILRLIARGEGFIDQRKIWGILSLDKRYAKGQIDLACKRALEMESLSYRTVKGFLEIEEVRELEESGRMGFTDQRREFAPGLEKQHKHVRPLSVYQEQLSLFKH